MYSDRLSNMASMFATDTGRKPEPVADGRAQLDAALREAVAAKLELRYRDEVIPALRDAARAYLQFVLLGIRAGLIRDDLVAAGHKAPAPRTFMIDPAGLKELVATLVETGLIDAHDVLLVDMPLP